MRDEESHHCQSASILMLKPLSIDVPPLEGISHQALQKSQRRQREIAVIWSNLLIGISLLVSGCAIRQPGSGIEAVRLTQAVMIPAQRAHTVFQAGRQVGGANFSEPYCELEIETVAGQAQRVPAGSFRVRRESQTMLKDPTTRIPALIAGFSCSDGVYQESIWWLDGDASSPVLYLRCLAPYFNCRIGGPLSPQQVQQVVGPRIEIKLSRALDQVAS